MKRESSDDTPEQLGSSWLRRVRIVEQFEDRWQETGEADVAEFLAAMPTGPSRTELLRELVKVDLEYRWRRGEAVRVESYAARFPELGDACYLPLDLIAEEFRIRRLHRSPVTPQELAERFENRLEEIERIAAAAGSAVRVSDRGDRPQSEIHPPGSTPNDQSVTPPLTRSGTSIDPADGVCAGLERMPRRLGRYEIVERLGHGGFSTVYRAIDTELRREVAVKVLRAELMELPGAADRVEREAQTAARLRHPAIVPIYEVGSDQGLTYIVYEFVRGPTLTRLLRDTAPSPQQAAEWVARLADALAYAHQNGIVHRDVKPANVMMDERGQPVLTDFGLALQSDAAVTLTQHGDILGTPAYMSPEQARGEGHHVDARTDVYSLGVLLYEILCGRLPFQGATASILHKVLHDEPSPPRQCRGDVPVDLETICMKAMAKEPARRYAAADQLADDLRAYLEHRPISARRVGPLGRLVRWCRRRPALAATIATAVVAVALIAAVSYRQILGERDLFRAERDRAQELLYRSLVSNAHAQLRGRDTGWWWKAMDDIRQAAQLQVAERNTAELRALAIQCMGTQYPCFRLLAEWDGHSGPVTAVAYDPTGRFVASGSRDQTVRIWAAGTGETVAVLEGHGGVVSDVGFHPSGAWIASCSADGIVRIWSVDRLQLGERSPRPERELDLGGAPQRALEYAPDGRGLVVAGGDGVARWIVLEPGGTTRVDGTGRAEVREFRGHTGAILSLAVAPDGTQLATGSADQTVRLWDSSRGMLRGTLPRGNSTITMAYSADQFLFAVGDAESYGFAYKYISNDRWNGQPQLHAGAVTKLRFMRGNRVITGSADGTVRVWPPRKLAEAAIAQNQYPAVSDLSLSPDERFVVAGYADGTLRVWELGEPPQRSIFGAGNQSAAFLGNSYRLVDEFLIADLGAEALALRDYVHAPVRTISVHPDGRRIALLDGAESIRVHDIAEAVERARWQDEDGPVAQLAGSPDGRWLAAASRRGNVKLWDWESHQVARSVELGTSATGQLEWSADSRHLAAIGRDGAVVWNVESGVTRELSRSVSGDRPLAAGGDWIAFCPADDVIEIQEVATGQAHRAITRIPSRVAALAVSRDGRWIAAATTDQTIRIWDNETGEEAKLILDEFSFSRMALAFQPQGDLIAVLSDRGCFVVDRRTMKALAVRSAMGQSVAFTTDGQGIVIGTRTGSVLLWSLADIEQARLEQGAGSDAELVGAVRVDTTKTVVDGGHISTVWGVASSVDGRWFATASHDQTVKLWNAATQRPERTLTGHDDLVWCVAFSPDSRLLASGGTGVKVWHVDSGRIMHEFSDHREMVTSVAFHPNGQVLASSGNDGMVQLRELPSGDSLGLLGQLEGPVHKLAFHPNGRWLAAACNDQRVALWDIGSIATDPRRALPAPRPPDRSLAGHPGPARAVAFTSDGRYLASGSEQGVIVLWDGTSFDRVVELKGGTGQIRELCFSFDSRMLAGAAYVSPAIVWDLDRLRSTLREMNLDW